MALALSGFSYPTASCNYYTYNYNSYATCITRFEYDLPSCYNYYTNGPCCTSYVNVVYSYLNCLSGAYGSNCWDFNYYSYYLSSYPCYTSIPNPSSPASVSATTTRVPNLILTSVSFATITTTSTHSPIPTYTGVGSLLQGYCATHDYVLLDGPSTAFWAPVVGCANGKSDCCPYAVAQTTPGATVTVVVTTTGGSTNSGLQAYPLALNPAEATLANCPNDYISISGGCCPSGYQLWNVALGGQVPCYSSLASNDDPPPIPITADQAPPPTVKGSLTKTSSTRPTGKPTSAILNIVYAVQFPVQEQSNSLSVGAKAGIGAGAGVAGIAIVALVFLLIRSIRKNKKMKSATATSQGNPSMVQSQNGASSLPSPYAYSNRTELQADGLPQQVQTPGGFVQQPQGSYFPQQPPQMQGYYAPQQLQPDQFSQQQYQNVQGQPSVSYPSPPTSTISTGPPSDSRYSYQTGYGSQGAIHQVPSHPGLQDPRATYAGGMSPQQNIPQQHSELQGYQQSGYASPVPQQNPQYTGQGPQHDSQMGYTPPSAELQSVPAGNHSELRGYQGAGYILAPSQQQTRSLEQRSSQQPQSAQYSEAQESTVSGNVDPASVPALQSPQQPNPSSVSRRPVPQRTSNAHELAGTDSRQ